MREYKQHTKRVAKALSALATWLVQGIIGAVLVLGGAIVLIEWASGCGESYVDSKGVTHTNQCLLTNLMKGDKTTRNT